MDPLTELLDKFKKQKKELLCMLGNHEERKLKLSGEIEDINVQIICLEALEEAIDELKQRLENKRKGN
jgi:hypothetical protein